jgi:beta-galactosidase
MSNKNIIPVVLLLLVIQSLPTAAQTKARTIESFNQDWKFYLGDASTAKDIDFNDAGWRSLQLPHDWSVELAFDEKSPTGTGGGALR